VAGAIAVTLRAERLLPARESCTEGTSRTVSGISNSASSTWRGSLPDWARKMFEERAAILEFDGELPRTEAERRARAEVESALRREIDAHGQEGSAR
jgi:hypothetical protein